MNTQTEPKRYAAVVFSPDKNSDYIYLNVTEAEGIEKFKAGEDWLRLYKPAGYEPKPMLVETESFMLWRNQGNDLAKMMVARGIAPEMVGLVGNPKEG